MAKGLEFTGENVPVSLDSFGRQEPGISRSGQSGYASTASRTALPVKRSHKIRFGGESADQELTSEQIQILALGRKATENLETVKTILPFSLGGLDGIAATVNSYTFKSLP